MRLLFITFCCLLASSCIKPYACECTDHYNMNKKHVLIYANKHNREEACKKNGQDTTITCVLKN